MTTAFFARQAQRMCSPIIKSAISYVASIALHLVLALIYLAWLSWGY